MEESELRVLRTAVYAVSGSMIVASIMLMFSIARFISTHESTSAKRSLNGSVVKDGAVTSAVTSMRRSRQANPFTALLFTMIMSTIALFACNIVRAAASDQTYLITTVFMDAFNFTAEICYMIYSWYRGSSILILSFPSLRIPIQTTIYSLPVVSLGQISCDFLKVLNLIPVAQRLGRWFAIAAGALIVSYDLLIAAAFARYLYTCKGAEAGVSLDSERFHIIARHGLVSSFLLLVGLGIYVMSTVLAKSTAVSVLLSSLLYCLFFCVALVLFRMKVALHREKVEKKSMRATRLEEVLGTEEVRRIQNTSSVLN
ncbi:hypothetical protein HDU78_004762 [Chytriomyces hyalinus]|nr:hypothetical protein HDU78_004762 [Chytriomyces hyalinus]